MALLENFVYGDECLERLDFVSEDGLHFETSPYRCRGVVVPGIDDTFCADGSKGHQRPDEVLELATYCGRVSVLGRFPL